jgi:hypothetical protein
MSTSYAILSSRTLCAASKGAFMLLISNHARCRYTERFPSVPLTIEDAFKTAIPFGGSLKPNETMYLNVEHNIVFAVVYNGDSRDRIIKTVLTRDHATVSLPKSVDARAWQKGGIAPADPIRSHTENKQGNLQLEQYTIEIIDALRKLAKNDVAAWDYCYPDAKEAKRITREIREKHNYPKKAIENHYWKEVGRLIYEHNSTYRSVVKNTERVETR